MIRWKVINHFKLKNSCFVCFFVNGEKVDIAKNIIITDFLLIVNVLFRNIDSNLFHFIK